jgi:hypothetical protein
MSLREQIAWLQGIEASPGEGLQIVGEIDGQGNYYHALNHSADGRTMRVAARLSEGNAQLFVLAPTLRRIAIEALELVVGLEEGGVECPQCGNYEWDKPTHKSDCALAAFLCRAKESLKERMPSHE